MEFSDKHKEKLKRLAELYARDDISDAEYQDLYRETIAEFGDSVEELRVLKDGLELPPAERPQSRSGRNGTKESVHTPRAAFDISDREEGRQPTTELSNRMVQRSSASAPAESEARRHRHSFLPKQPVDGSSVSSSSAHNTVYREPPKSSGSSSNNPAISRSGSAAPLSVQRRYRKRMSAILIAPVMFAFGIVLAVAVTRVMSANVEPPKKPIDRPGKIRKPVAPRANNFLQPMFGPVAVDQCTQGCITAPEVQRQVCSRACKRLHLTAFGRRITATRLDPAADAKEAANRCLTRTADLDSAPDEEFWHRQMTEAQAALGRLSPAGEAAQRIVEVSKTLLLPAEGDKAKTDLTFNLLKALCLRAHQTLAHAGLDESMRVSDDYSADYYLHFETAIEADSMEFERRTPLAIPELASVSEPASVAEPVAGGEEL